MGRQEKGSSSKQGGVRNTEERLEVLLCVLCPPELTCYVVCCIPPPFKTYLLTPCMHKIPCKKQTRCKQQKQKIFFLCMAFGFVCCVFAHKNITNSHNTNQCSHRHKKMLSKSCTAITNKQTNKQKGFDACNTNTPPPFDPLVTRLFAHSLLALPPGTI